MNALPSIVSGLGDGVLLFLIASGLSVIFGAMRFLNFAHGAFFAIGGYLTYNFLQHTGMSPVLLVLASGARLSRAPGRVPRYAVSAS